MIVSEQVAMILRLRPSRISMDAAMLFADDMPVAAVAGICGMSTDLAASIFCTHISIIREMLNMTYEERDDLALWLLRYTQYTPLARRISHDPQ